VQRALVVSIHDVAPASQAQVENIVEQLRQLGVSTCSLLVVPNYHWHGPSLEQPAFCTWLREISELGHEIVIHGFFHERRRRRDETVREKIVTRFYTADEGEFFDIDYATALDLICTAKCDFARHGFHPSGFIAPAWLLGAKAERAAIDAGMTYTTTLDGVRDFAAQRTFDSQSIVYSVRSSWRRAASLIWNRWLLARLTPNELLRISIHPPDIGYPAVWRQIMSFVDHALSSREATTYEKWLRGLMPSETEESRGQSIEVKTFL
jgi:predicted deacetylase